MDSTSTALPCVVWSFHETHCLKSRLHCCHLTYACTMRRRKRAPSARSSSVTEPQKKTRRSVEEGITPRSVPFRYKPLNPGANEIRVLDVSPTLSNEQTLRCRIRTISLDARPLPEYETISYFWGDPNPRSQIVMNGRLVRVPGNTELALRRMIVGHQSRVLWVDAICINQEDIREREQQVQLMRRVYSLSRRTLVFLDSGSTSTGSTEGDEDANMNQTELRSELWSTLLRCGTKSEKI